MGASGAGKTTLLNIISCRIPFVKSSTVTDSKMKVLDKATGNLLANDTSYDFTSFGDFANYVMQEDVLLQSLTVR
jgi:ABC-type lipoprotein export system ATPase subunit